LILLILVGGAIASMAYYSAQSDAAGPRDVYIKLNDMSLTKSRFSVEILNDGLMEVDVESAELEPGRLNCWRKPQGIKPGESQRMSCIASGIEDGLSYMLIILVKDVSGEIEYRASTYVSPRPV
jgi:hypothetical protein